MNAILATLQEEFPDARVAKPYGQSVVHLPAEEIADVVAFLKRQGFSLLLDITAVDRLGREPRFDVVYHLYHLAHADWLRLEAQVGGERPEVPSVARFFAAANWAERECYDMFGIAFAGHPDLRRILMPGDWTGHPLRKDYPLTGWDPLPPLVRE